MSIYFSDFFEVTPETLEDHGALNISLINDLPVFVDPFLLFNSEKEEYRHIHDEIIEYLRFLRDMSVQGRVNEGLLKSWFRFSEVKQNWLGYSKTGNNGSGLGGKFATALNSNLNAIFSNFGNENISTGSHLEKLCLIREGVGRDNISDFTTNLIKGFLCDYTEKYAKKYLDDRKACSVSVSHVRFNYKTRTWMHGTYYLPFIDGDFVLLSPKDILTKDDTWINRNDLVRDFHSIASSISNAQLRAEINDYFIRIVPEESTKKDLDRAAATTAIRFPSFLDYYIKFKEEHGEAAERLSAQRIQHVESLFIQRVEQLSIAMLNSTDFYKKDTRTFQESYQRVMYLKHFIEDNDGYRVFYINGEPVKREYDLQLMYRLVWFASPSSVDAEVNNGRGPVDYKISRGSKDATLVEFKLASNTQLKRNLENQVEVYKQANRTDKAIKVIIYFTDSELNRVIKILNGLGISESEELVLIDARSSNKISASRA